MISSTTPKVRDVWVRKLEQMLSDFQTFSPYSARPEKNPKHASNSHNAADFFMKNK
jgi:hypothetical protein